MSSFAIDKKEYVKAAGAVAGIVAASERGRNRIYLYDYEQGRPMEGEDFYRVFVKFFEYNAQSVYDQYAPNHDDEELYTDDEDYRFEFRQFSEIGRRVYANLYRLQDTVLNLADFFRSALYQTEREDYSAEMERFFNRLTVQLFGLLHPHECKCWGSFTASVSA